MDTNVEIVNENKDLEQQEHGTLNASWDSPPNLIITELPPNDKSTTVGSKDKTSKHQKIIASDELASAVPLSPVDPLTDKQ